MKNQKETIRKMVTYLNNEEEDGGYWLPNIQRSFVWNEDQIYRIFDSIMREYPIGTLLVWKTKYPVRRRKFIDNYRRTLKLTDFYVPENDKMKLLVLDGQQRLQSFFIGLKGSYEQKELFFDVLSGALVAPEDVKFRFKFIDSKVATFPWIKFKDIITNSEPYNRVAKSIIKQSPNTLSDEELARIEDNVAMAVKQFCDDDTLAYQELDSIDKPKTYNEDDVVEIFIRANSGGTRLGKSDLLFSLLISAWEDADERLGELLDDLNKSGYEFTRDFVLKTCLSLLEKGARYEVNKFRDGTTKQAIIESWDSISSAIKDVRDFLFGKTFLRTEGALPSYLGLIPLIYFRYHYPEKWKNAQNLDDYILRTMITGAFSGTPDSLIDKCNRLISEQKEFIVNQMFGVIRAEGRSLEVTPSTILGQYYGSKGIHLIFNLWYKDFNYSPSYENNLPQVDHIFPQSLLRSVKVKNPDTGIFNILKYKQEDRDQIVNCMLLTAEENGAGGKRDIPPEFWFADQPESYLDMHLIPKDKELWKLDHFEGFIEARKNLILEKFKYLIQSTM